MSEPPSSQPSQQPQPPSTQQPPPSSSDQLNTFPPSSSEAEASIVPKLEPESSDPADTALAADPEIENMAGNTSANAEAGAEVGAGAGAEAPAPIGNPVQATSVDAVQSSKKETSLREFLGKMDEYAPIIPDAVTAHYLTLAGLPPPGTGPNQTPPHLARLLALATQKFIADIAADSYQYARIRASNSSSASNPMGSLNAASGLGVPGAGATGGTGAAGGGAGDAGKGGSKAGTHLGIQRAGFGGGGSGGSGQGRTVLTMEDLGMAVSEYGVSVKRGEFYR
ncbi:transcription initiation factor TFIID 23-30kDa subunit-domain-containing protein [Aspergillus egyptiacus]|nr:transcription initiation factor TFIID 23-30kDa subunit-domain-containing protein [Aspergillus egyptiacus]